MPHAEPKEALVIRHFDPFLLISLQKPAFLPPSEESLCIRYVLSASAALFNRGKQKEIYINNSVRLLKGYTQLLVFCPEFLFFKKNYSTVSLNYFNYGLQNRDGNVISAVLSVTIKCKTPRARSLLRLHFKKLCQKNLHHTHACVICDFADRIQFYVDLFLY